MPPSSVIPGTRDPVPAPPDAFDDTTDPVVPITLQTLGASRVMLGELALGMHNALLFMLVLRMAYAPSMAVRRDVLLEEFWPDQEEPRQRGNLRQALYKLRNLGVRTALHGDVVQLDAGQVQRTFSLTPSAEAFDRDITRGSEPYGVFLPDIVPPTPMLQEWLERTRESMHGAVRRVLVEVLRARRERADWNGTQMVAQWLLQLDPLNEDGTLALAECAALTGSKAEAIGILDRYLAEIGPGAGDIRLPAALLRRRFAEVPQRRRSVALVTDQYFVGREQELSELTMSLRRARWHDGSAVLLHGPPGMGKSRLMAELLKVAQLEGYLDVVLECRESIRARPLGALIEALPELLNAPGAIGCSPESLAVLRRLLGPDFELPDAQSTTHTLDKLSPSERIDYAVRTMRAQSIRHAIVDLIAAVSEERPIFLLVEDGHWVDDPSWEVISDVVQRVNSMRVHLVITSRFPNILEERPARIPTALTFKRLAPLDTPSLTSVIHGVASEHQLTVEEEIESWILAGCEGNPLLLRALLEHWAATGIADGVPPSLSALIDQRIDRLPGHAQQALQATSLLGQFASLERIKLVLELPVHELILALEQLEFSGCLFTGEKALVVSHQLVRQVATRRMSPLIESAMRASVADVLETEYNKTLDVVVLYEALSHTESSGRPEVLHRYLTTYHEALLEGGKPTGVLSAIDTLAKSFPFIFEERHFEILKSRLNTQAGSYRRAVGNYLGTLQLPADTTNLQVPDLEELIAIMDSAHRADPVIDRDALAQFSATLAERAELPFSTRLRAAEVGLTIAANTCDPTVASRCFDSVRSEIDSTSADDSHNRIALLYHAIFGDLSVAQTVAREIIRKALRRSSSTSVAQDLGRSAFALRLAGDTEGAVSTLKKHFAMAVELEVPRLGLFSAWQIAQIELEKGDLHSVAHWNKKLAAILENDDDPIYSSFVTAHYCRCAIEERNRGVALKLLSKVKEAQPKLPTSKAAAYMLALELGCELLNSKWTPSRDMLEAASERHRQTARYGTSDFFTAMIADSFVRLGKKDAARSFIGEYIANARRENGELSRALSAVLKKVS